jgi:signal transduction histidine kinase
MGGLVGLGVGGLHPRTARTITVAALATFVSVYALAALTGPGRAAAVVPLTVAVFVLQLRFVLPRLARFQTRSVLLLQGVLTYLAVVPFGVSVGMLSPLTAALLLSSAPRTAALVVATAPVVDIARGGSPGHVLDVSIMSLVGGLVIYGLCRLTDRIEEVYAARLTLAMSAVEEERLRMAAKLNESIGQGLDEITAARPEDLDEVLSVARESLATARTAAADLRSLSLAPEVAAARGLLAAADVEATVRIGHTEPLGQAGALLATVLREAVTDVVRQGTARHCTIETTERDALLTLKVASDGVPTADRGAEPLQPLTGRVEEAGGRLTMGLAPNGLFTVEAQVTTTEPTTAPPAPRPSREHRLSLALLATILVGFCVKGLLQLSPGDYFLAVPCLAAICAIQLHWVRTRARHWPWALAAQAVLSYAPIALYGKAWGGTSGFLVGSILVLLPAAAAWPLALATAASISAIAWAVGSDAALIVNSLVSPLVTGLIVYGLIRLAQLADELSAAGDGLARAAVVQERLRAARDLHDLLGHTLAAILLKGELARRLQATDPERARAELADVTAMAERARADMETVTGAAPRLELGPELTSAVSVLEAAGITVRVTRTGDPPAEAAPLLSTVLREAVTNVLRHSTAENVEITVAADRLTVQNDGTPAEVTPPGSGIGNLSTRVAAEGGTLDARPVGKGHYRLTATLAPAITS